MCTLGMLVPCHAGHHMQIPWLFDPRQQADVLGIVALRLSPSCRGQGFAYRLFRPPTHVTIPEMVKLPISVPEEVVPPS